MPDPPSFAECIQRIHDQFRLYDRAVDLVSCWQFFFTQVEPIASNTICFDRFPRLHPPTPEQGTAKRPDFAILLSNSYGVVGECKAGFPRDDESFLRHAKRLKKYDQPLAFRGNRDETKVPSNHDIILIVPLRDAQEIVTRLEGKIRKGELTFERSLIVFEWFYDADLGEYIFRKVAGQSSDFRDISLPAEIRLSRHFSERNASLKITPDKIKSLKATWQFCNDAPPVIFTLVFLWTKIFYHLLAETQREAWRRRDPQRTMPIDLTIPRLRNEIEARYPLRWGHWTDWGREALNALVSAGLARRVGRDRYIVGFRNLTRELGEPGQRVAGEVPHRPADYARILATYLCRRGLGDKAADPEHPKTPPLFS